MTKFYGVNISQGKIKKLHPHCELVELYGVPAQRIAEPQWNGKHGAEGMAQRAERKEHGA